MANDWDDGEKGLWALNLLQFLYTWEKHFPPIPKALSHSRWRWAKHISSDHILLYKFSGAGKSSKAYLQDALKMRFSNMAAARSVNRTLNPTLLIGFQSKAFLADDVRRLAEEESANVRLIWRLLPLLPRNKLAWLVVVVWLWDAWSLLNAGKRKR